MSAFDYGSADAWGVGGGYLPAGQHVVTIDQAEDGTSTKGFPQLELSLSNEHGSVTDKVVITPNTIGKVASVYDAAGVERPAAGEFDPGNGRLTTVAIARLVNKKVGIVIVQEPGYNDPSKTFHVVKGYLAPVQLASDIPADTTGLPAAGGPAQQQLAGATGTQNATNNDTVPF